MANVDPETIGEAQPYAQVFDEFLISLAAITDALSPQEVAVDADNLPAEFAYFNSRDAETTRILRLGGLDERSIITALNLAKLLQVYWLKSSAHSSSSGSSGNS